MRCVIYTTSHLTLDQPHFNSQWPHVACSYCIEQHLSRWWVKVVIIFSFEEVISYNFLLYSTNKWSEVSEPEGQQNMLTFEDSYCLTRLLMSIYLGLKCRPGLGQQRVLPLGASRARSKVIGTRLVVVLPGLGDTHISNSNRLGVLSVPPDIAKSARSRVCGYRLLEAYLPFFQLPRMSIS